MARIEFVPDLRREGACGTWGAILLGDGGLCAAMRLPVAASDRATIDRVLTAIREVMRASVPGVAPIADVAYTSAIGRRAFPVRRAIVTDTGNRGGGGAAGSQTPASARRSLIRSVRSHANSGSLRPKCP